MWSYMKDSCVKKKSFRSAIHYFRNLHPETKPYMDCLEESLENMQNFYPEGLHANMSDDAGIIWDKWQYIEWNKGVYAMGIEWIDDDRIYIYLNSNEMS